ncbi:MAG: hypothetical protein PV344_05390, partial [Anaplasma sp.]|nr:hypothetical protein [Anaplasma sp.]
TQLLEPETEPLDTSDEWSDSSDSEDIPAEPLDRSYRPDDSINADYEADTSDIQCMVRQLRDHR